MKNSETCRPAFATGTPAAGNAPASEHACLVLARSAIDGLEDVAAARVLNEAELDQALSAIAGRGDGGNEI